MIRMMAFVAAFSLAGFALLDPIERAMVYPFDDTRIAPADAGDPRLQEVFFQSGGETLILWVAPPKPGKPTLLYFHGNAGNLANRTGRFTRFLDRGYGLIAPAYRGSSGSTGTPTEPDLHADAARIYASVGELVTGLTPDQTFLYGESLGTGVAIALATSKTDPEPAAIILEAPYTSIPDVALHSYPVLAPAMAMMQNRWDSISRAPDLTSALLILHGDADTLIPIEQGQQIFAAAPAQIKHFYTVKSAGHTDIWRSDSLPVLWQFIDDQAANIR